MMNFFRRWFHKDVSRETITMVEPDFGLKNARAKMSPQKMQMMASAIKAMKKAEREQKKDVFKTPQLPAGVLPKGMAMDTVIPSMAQIFSYANSMGASLGFLGYPFLAELAQKSEYRAPVETTATEMTRQWIELVSKGEDKAKDEKLKELTDEFERFKVRDHFRLATLHDGFFGRGQILVKIKGQEGDALKHPLIVDKRTIEKGSLIGFKNIEPVWMAPLAYNSSEPEAADFYKPSRWYVLGKEYHASRFLFFISRPVSDILKPSYNFSGLSLIQLMMPYAERWERTVASVSDMVHAFSVSGIETDLATILQDDSDQSITSLTARAELFQTIRDNMGLMLLNKEEEKFFQFNTPLSGLSDLQQQAIEQMAAPSHIPLVKLLGITPSGLNATAEGEIQVFYDFIRAMQENQYTDPLRTVLQIIQLNKYGEIDPDIDFRYLSMEEADPKEESDIIKSKADMGVAYISAGVIDPEEERTRLANDPKSGYNGINPADVPKPPMEENPDEQPAGEDKMGEDAWLTVHPNGEEDERLLETGGWDDLPDDELAMDEWEEGKHPRDKGGRFTSGGGYGGGTREEARAKRDAGQDYHDQYNQIRQGGLSPSERHHEGFGYGMIRRNGEAMLEQYRGMAEHRRFVDPDKVKNLFPAYAKNTDLARAYHEPSSAFAKKIWTHILKEKKEAGDKSPVVFTAGGSGSGKGATLAFAKKALGMPEDAMTLDSVLGGFDSAVKKIDETIKGQEGPIVIAYTNTHVEKAMKFNAGRSRAVSARTLLNAHVGASNNLRKLAEHYKDNPRVQFHVINNNASLDEISFGKHEDVPNYNPEGMHKRLLEIADELLASGKIDERRHAVLHGKIKK